MSKKYQNKTVIGYEYLFYYEDWYKSDDILAVNIRGSFENWAILFCK